MCIGGNKQPKPPIQTPSYSADKIDENMSFKTEDVPETISKVEEDTSVRPTKRVNRKRNKPITM